MLQENLMGDLGKLLFEKSFTEENYQNYKEYSNGVLNLDLFIKSNSDVKPNNYGFLILHENNYKHRLDDLKNALQTCNYLYIIIDLKKRNHLYDLLIEENLEEIGIIGTLSSYQLDLCRRAKWRKSERELI